MNENVREGNSLIAHIVMMILKDLQERKTMEFFLKFIIYYLNISYLKPQKQKCMKKDGKLFCFISFLNTLKLSKVKELNYNFLK